VQQLMSKPNVAAVLLAIYVSKQIAECKVPELRYAPKPTCGGGSCKSDSRSSLERMAKSLKFVLSVLGVREVAVVASIITALLCRSLLRLKQLTLSTDVENSVMRGSERSFWKAIQSFSLYVIPTSASYAVFNYKLSELAIGVRSSITTRLLSKFTTGKVFFQVINATQLQSIAGDGNNAVQSSPNPDQILTNDVEHFSYALSGLFSHVMRPMVDIIINAHRLYITGGAVVPLVMGLYLVVTSNVLNYIRSPIGSFTDHEQSLEGEYRSLIARIATSAEEIAALEGGKNEENNVLQSLHPLLEYSRKFAQFRCNMSFIDAVVARYWLMMLGWRIVGLHFFRASGRVSGDIDGHSNRSGAEFLFRDYQNMSKTMLALSNAVGELIMSGRDAVKVFAYAEKLSTFEEALDELLRRDAALKEGNNTSSVTETPTAGGSSVGSSDDLLAPELVGTGSLSRLTFAPLHCIALENVSIVPPSGGAPLHTGLNVVFKR
jgi:ATP-binding cassette subfamily D (ALD) long-chain fatty acid import protein